MPLCQGVGLIKLCIPDDSCAPRRCGVKMLAVTRAGAAAAPAAAVATDKMTAGPECAAARDGPSAAVTFKATRKDALISTTEALAAATLAKPSVAAGSQQPPIPASTAPSAAPAAAAPATPSAAPAAASAGATATGAATLAQPPAAPVITSQFPRSAQCSPSAAPALPLATTAVCIQTSPKKTAAIPLDSDTNSLLVVDLAVGCAARGCDAAAAAAAAAPGSAVAVGGAVAPTQHTVVVDLPPAASLSVATQIEATAAASSTQAGAGAVVAKAAAGNETEAAAADASGASASGQKAELTAQKGPFAAQKALAPSQKAYLPLEPTTQQGPSAAQEALAPSQKAALADQEAAAGGQKAFSDADTEAIGSDVAQLAMPDDISHCVAEAQPIAAVKAPTGASKAVFLDVTATSPPVFRMLMLEDGTTVGTTVEPALASIAEYNLSMFIHGIRPRDPHWWPGVSL